MTPVRFLQQIPDVPDLYESDHVLRSALDRVLGDVGHKASAPLLEALAAEISGSLRAAHLAAERHPPELIQYDAWGRRIDRVDTPEGWRVMRAAAARHGVVALPYESGARATWGAGARVVQLALLHLYGPESATFSCPVAMSDGAAALLSAPDVDRTLRDRWLPRLLSRDPGMFATSGQWMTETQGGSDVGRTTTTAERQPDGTWRLFGEKWFCSAIDSELSVALARPAGGGPGSRGLTCWVIPRYAGDSPIAGTPSSPDDTAPGVSIHRLKDKLGTRPLPSAEVRLDGAFAWPLGDPGTSGISRMMRLVQVTRLHNAAAAAGGMRRGLVMARTHAGAREAFGRVLDAQPLHRETLAWLAVDAEAAFHLTLLCFDLLGRVENADDGPAAAGHSALLRFAATLAKLGTGKLAVASASEYVECFGGNGFIEDTGVPRLLRDAQVLPIWEGTTNVLALDVARALSRDGALAPYLERVDQTLDEARTTGTLAAATAERLAQSRAGLVEHAESAAADPTSPRVQSGARVLAIGLADLLAAAALLEQANFEAQRGNPRSAQVAEFWIRRRLFGDSCAGEGHQAFETLVDGELG